MATRSRTRLVAFSGIMLVAVLVAAELVLRGVYPAVRSASLPEEMIRAHTGMGGFRYDPDLLWYWEKVGVAGVNRQGLNHPEDITEAPAPGVTRVFAVGDSQTLGAGLKPAASYAGVADSTLDASWEVLNAGISGYRSLNVYRLVQRKLAALNPDVIVVDCFPYDSPRDNGPLAAASDGESVVQALQRLLWQSRLYYAVRLAVDKTRPDKSRWLSQSASALVADRGLGNHDLLVEWGDAHDVGIVFLQYPIREGEHGIDCMTKEGELPEGAPVSRACDAVADDGRSAAELFFDRNHLSAAGSAVVGRRLAEDLDRWRRGEPLVAATRTWVNAPGKGGPPPPNYQMRQVDGGRDAGGTAEERARRASEAARRAGGTP